MIEWARRINEVVDIQICANAPLSAHKNVFFYLHLHANPHINTTVVVCVIDGTNDEDNDKRYSELKARMFKDDIRRVKKRVDNKY